MTTKVLYRPFKTVATTDIHVHLFEFKQVLKQKSSMSEEGGGGVKKV
jgi:hypothetical protein